MKRELCETEKIRNLAAALVAVRGLSDHREISIADERELAGTFENILFALDIVSSEYYESLAARMK